VITTEKNPRKRKSESRRGITKRKDARSTKRGKIRNGRCLVLNGVHATVREKSGG